MSANPAGSPKIGSWSALWKELKARTTSPVSHPSFVIYFVVAVVVAGGAGVWLEVYVYLVELSKAGPDACPSLAALRTAVMTFFPALAGSASLQLIWAEDQHRSLRAFATLILISMTISALIVGQSNAISATSALCIGVTSSLVAFWTWWIANAKQKDFLDPPNIDAPTGGNPNAPLAGNLKDFTV